MKVFWIEGLPGSGKTTLIRKLHTVLEDVAIFFPKLDLPALFSNLDFDCRASFSLDCEVDIAMERLKVSILNCFRSDKYIIGERSYISTCVYYSIINKENRLSKLTLEKTINCLFDNYRKYEEFFIYLDCSGEESISRDQHAYSGFWKDACHIEVAKQKYLEFLKRFPSNNVCIIPREKPQFVFRKAWEFINE